MHPLHDYVAKQLAEKLKSKTIVVWYDPRREFAPFVDELRGAKRISAAPVAVVAAGIPAHVVEYDGSFFEVRAVVEPLVAVDTPSPVLIYVPGTARDHRGSVLMELEKAGDCWEPKLGNLARYALRQRYTDGVSDDMVAEERRATYEDFARAASDTAAAEPPSLLKVIFHDTPGNDGILAAWLAGDARDAEIENKRATAELKKLVRSRLALELPEADLPKLRAITLRYVLVGEFRSDLRCPPPPGLESVPEAKTAEDVDAVRALAKRLRTSFPGRYAELADRVEDELGLRNVTIAAPALGAIDTFRFEEKALLKHCGSLIAEQKFDDALALVSEREQSFWLDRDVARKAQWEACRRMAELGKTAKSILAAVLALKGDAGVWIAQYTAPNGWFRMDQAQRRLEAWVSNLDEDPDERALGVVRQAYEAGCRAMAEGFSKAFAGTGFAATGSLHQTQIYRDVVAGRPKPVAYFLVDAMRFEMGVELAERLPKAAEVSVRHAIAALPSITPVGMAALQPGASSSFSIVAEGGKLGARIDGNFLPDLTARKKFAAGRIPKLVDLSLDQLLGLQASKLEKKIEGAEVIIVRSQEIDHAGESGFAFQTPLAFETVLGGIARAVRKLAGAGVEHSVISADHGHLFFASDRDESMRVESPGGKEVDLHRRCWIGRGGATPPGCVRVAASALGYDSDLDFVFPAGCGVFKAGGDLAFHHGGTSLQEIVIPVLTVRLKTRGSAPPRAGKGVDVKGEPHAVTNRIFSVSLVFGPKQLALGATGAVVRPLLISAGRQVGAAGMVIDGTLDRETGNVELLPGKAVTVAFILSDENVSSLRVVVQDAATDAELYRSPADIPVRLGV